MASSHLLLFSCLVTRSCPTLLQPHVEQPARLLCPWDSPGKNTRMGCQVLLQGIFLTQGSNPGLLRWHAGSLPLSHLGSSGYPRCLAVSGRTPVFITYYQPMQQKQWFSVGPACSSREHFGNCGEGDSGWSFSGRDHGCHTSGIAPSHPTVKTWPSSCLNSRLPQTFMLTEASCTTLGARHPYSILHWDKIYFAGTVS